MGICDSRFTAISTLWACRSGQSCAADCPAGPVMMRRMVRLRCASAGGSQNCAPRSLPSCSSASSQTSFKHRYAKQPQSGCVHAHTFHHQQRDCACGKKGCCKHVASMIRSDPAALLLRRAALQSWLLLQTKHGRCRLARQCWAYATWGSAAGSRRSAWPWRTSCRRGRSLGSSAAAGTAPSGVSLF